MKQILCTYYNVNSISLQFTLHYNEEKYHKF